MLVNRAESPASSARFVGQAESLLKQIMDYSSEPLRATSSTNFGAISLNHNPTLP